MRFPTRRTRTASILILLIFSPLLLASEEEEVSLSGPLYDDPLPFESGRDLPIKGGSPSFEEDVVERVNQERWDNGQLPPLKRNDLLDSASETHSSNMGTRNFFAHCDLDTGSSPGSRMTDAGYFFSSAAENIAAGQPTPAAVMSTWMGSSGHRGNILSTSYREIGVGYFLDSGDTGNIRQDPNGDCVTDVQNSGPFFRYWTQNFGRRNSIYPVVIEREAFLTQDRNVSLYLYGSGWAVDMRLRNESGDWTDWIPFTDEMNWNLSAGSGPKTVLVELRNGAMNVLSVSDTIQLDDVSGTIFADGFESGNTVLWSEVVP